MNTKRLFVLSALVLFTATALFVPDPAPAAFDRHDMPSWHPSARKSTVFPVVATREFDTAEFLTLDEGLHSGEVM
jgi:hypothetical protein